MNATTVAVDLAKSVFQLAVADDAWLVVETHQLTCNQFERWFANREVSVVTMESITPTDDAVEAAAGWQNFRLSRLQNLLSLGGPCREF